MSLVTKLRGSLTKLRGSLKRNNKFLFTLIGTINRTRMSETEKTVDLPLCVISFSLPRLFRRKPLDQIRGQRIS